MNTVPAKMSLAAVLLAALLVGCNPPTRQLVISSQPAAPAAAPAPSGPPQVALTPASGGMKRTMVEISEKDHTLNGFNLYLSDLISVAYRTPERAHDVLPLLSALRVVPTAPLPEAGRFDVRVYVPGARAETLRAALRKTLEGMYGWTVRPQWRETDALVLTAPDRRPKPGPAEPAPALPPNTSRRTLSGDDYALLAEQLEQELQQPVVDETGLAGTYRLRLEQPLVDGKEQPITVDLARAALREQLGLELTPARRNVEFLIVEPALAPQKK